LTLNSQYSCSNGSAPPYLADELSHPADSLARCRLRSALSSILAVRQTHLAIVGDRSGLNEECYSLGRGLELGLNEECYSLGRGSGLGLNEEFYSLGEDQG